MAQRPTARINVQGGDLYVQIENRWVFTDNVNSFNVSEATRTTNEEVTINSGTYSTSSPAGAQTVTTAINGFNPNLEGHKGVLDAARNDTRLRNRIETQREEILASGASTAAVAASGAVTFSGTDPDFTGVLRGHSIQIGSNFHPIQAVDSDGKPTRVTAPESAVSASAYSIVMPIQRREWRGIPSKPSEDATAQAPVASSSITWTLDSSADLTDWTPVASKTTVS